MRPLILFSHGAGAGHDHPWLQRWRLRLSDIGDVFPLTYPYMAEGRRLPNPMAQLESAHIKHATALARKYNRQPLVMMGKSMGGRVAVRVANRVPAAAVVCFGYPLISSGKNPTRRDAPLREVEVPTLLVQGTRDPKSPIDDLLELVAHHPKQMLRLREVEDGDHSLECRKLPLRATARTQDDVDEEILYDIRRFLIDLNETARA